MKTLLVAAALIAGTNAAAQDFWEGTLTLPNGAQLPLQLELMTNAAGEPDANVVSALQGNRYMQVSEFEKANGEMRLRTAAPDAVFEGPIENGEWRATFTQGELSVPIAFSPIAEIAEMRALPENKGHAEQDVSIPSAAPEAMLGGSYVIPKTQTTAAVVILPGSGPSQRDGYHNGHRPLAELAFALADAGVASIRYDKRGIYKSTGVLDPSDLDAAKADALAALKWLEEKTGLPRKALGIVGHSEGGVIAAQASAEAEIGFAVSLMGPAMGIQEIFTLQDYTEAKAAGASESDATIFSEFTASLYQAAASADTGEQRMQALMQVLQSASEKQQALFGQYNGGSGTLGRAMLASDHYDELLAVDPGQAIASAKAPLLLAFGSKDVQVPAQENLEVVPANSNVRTVLLDQINHVLQQAETGAPAEYGEINHALAPKVSATIIEWIQKHIR